MYLLTPLPSFDDPQNYVQTISNLLKEEHRDKWEEAQLVSDKRVCVCVREENRSFMLTLLRWDECVQDRFGESCQGVYEGLV